MQGTKEDRQHQPLNHCSNFLPSSHWLHYYTLLRSKSHLQWRKTQIQDSCVPNITGTHQET